MNKNNGKDKKDMDMRQDSFAQDERAENEVEMAATAGRRSSGDNTAEG